MWGRQSLWAASGRVIVNEIVARRCIVAEPTTSPEQRDGELRNALEQIQSVMAVPALRCGLMSSCLAFFLSIMLRARSRGRYSCLTDYYLGRLQQECGGI
jgi:hypothetical protein